MPALLAGLVIAGCAPEHASTDTAAFTAEPVMSIGELDDPLYSFHRISSLTMDGRGHLYVADGGDHRIRVYTRDGRHVRDIGRQGHGPGEFLGIGTIETLRDMIYVIDRSADRVTFFDSAGVLRGTSRATRGSFGTGGTATSTMMLRADGLRIASEIRPPSQQERPPVVLLMRDSAVVDTVFIGEVVGVQLDRDGSSAWVPPLFGSSRIRSIGTKGLHVATVRMHPEAGLGPGEVEVEVRRIGDPAAQTVRLAERPAPYPARTADSIIAAMTAGVAEITARHGRARPFTESDLRAAMPPPKYHRPVRDALVDDTGRVFLRLHPEGETVEHVLIEGGRAAGRFRLPGTASIRLVRGDTLLVVEHDALDVPRIVEYRLQRPR